MKAWALPSTTELAGIENNQNTAMVVMSSSDVPGGRAGAWACAMARDVGRCFWCSRYETSRRNPVGMKRYFPPIHSVLHGGAMRRTARVERAEHTNRRLRITLAYYVVTA